MQAHDSSTLTSLKVFRFYRQSGELTESCLTLAQMSFSASKLKLFKVHGYTKIMSAAPANERRGVVTESM